VREPVRISVLQGGEYVNQSRVELVAGADIIMKPVKSQDLLKNARKMLDG
jgi:hypothetical protein